MPGRPTKNCAILNSGCHDGNCDVMYIQEGGVKLSVVNTSGRELQLRQPSCSSLIKMR